MCPGVSSVLLTVDLVSANGAYLLATRGLTYVPLPFGMFHIVDSSSL